MKKKKKKKKQQPKKMVNGFLRFPGPVLLWYSVWTLFYLFFSLSCLIFLPFLVLPLKLRVCLRREPQMSSFECSKRLDCSMLIGTIALLQSPCIYLLLKQFQLSFSKNSLSVVSSKYWLFCRFVLKSLMASLCLLSPRHRQKVRLWTVGDLFKPLVFWGWWGDC